MFLGSCSHQNEEKHLVWELRMGGFQEGGFQIVEHAAWKSVIAREFLLKIDTSLAIATSGLRTNLLFDKPLSENPPFDFPNGVVYKIRERNRAKKLPHTGRRGTHAFLGARQRSGKGVVRRNGCPKGCFLESPFLLCSLQVFRTFQVF